MSRRSLIWMAVEQLRQTVLPRPVWVALREPERGWAAELLVAWTRRLGCLRRHPKQVSKGLRSLWRFHFVCRQQPRLFISSSKPQLRIDAFDHTVVSVFEARSEEHTSELQSLMRISSAVFCLKKKTYKNLKYKKTIHIT